MDLRDQLQRTLGDAYSLEVDDPSFRVNLLLIARVHASAGRLQEALAALAKVPDSDSSAWTLGVRAYVLAKAGRVSDARVIAEQLTARARSGMLRLVSSMTSRRTLFPVVTLVAAGLLGALSCRRDDGMSRSTETALVEQRDLASTVLAIGALRPEIGAEVRVGSRISGRVQRLRANIGDRVTRGQVIAELETAELDAIVAEREAQLRLAEARLAAQDTSSPEGLARAAAEVARAVATEQLTSAELTRQQQLLASRGATTADVEAARERHLVAQAQLSTARREFDLAQREARAEHSRAVASLELAKVERSFTIIRAPISGTISAVATQEGETVAAGLSAPTFVTIVDLNRLQVHAYVDEVDIGKVRLRQEATFAVDAFPARDFVGRVAAIYPTATIQDNVVKYIVALDIADDSVGLLRPEMTASVRITLQPRSVLAIPARAIRRNAGQNVVTVRTDDGDVTRPVRIGWRDGPWIEIVNGLQAGERVVLDPPASPVEERR